MSMIFMSVLLGIKQPVQKPCVIDRCDGDTCVVETPEGFIEVLKKDSYEEGKRLSLEECPMDLIDPT